GAATVVLGALGGGGVPPPHAATTPATRLASSAKPYARPETVFIMRGRYMIVPVSSAKFSLTFEGHADGRHRAEDRLALVIDGSVDPSSQRALPRSSADPVARITDHLHVLRRAVRADRHHDLDTLEVDLVGVGLGREGAVPVGSTEKRRSVRLIGAGYDGRA